jgi:hypothetical protein
LFSLHKKSRTVILRQYIQDALFSCND